MTTCKCPHCGLPINPASLLGKGKKKTQSPAAIAARQANVEKARAAKLAKKAAEVPEGG